MICGMDKSIYELISSKIYEYVKDYVIAALAVNVTDSYVEIQNYWKESGDNFGMDNMQQILDCFKIDETKDIFEATCVQIPDLFIELYEDILTCFRKLYGDHIVDMFILSQDKAWALKNKIISILLKETSTLYKELDELVLIKNRLDILIPKLSKAIDYHEKYDAKELNNLIIKLIDSWGNLINKFHVITNMYLDEIYPKQVEAVYTEVMDSLINNILELLNKLLENNSNLSQAYTTLQDYFNILMEY